MSWLVKCSETAIIIRQKKTKEMIIAFHLHTLSWIWISSCRIIGLAWSQLHSVLLWPITLQDPFLAHSQILLWFDVKYSWWFPLKSVQLANWVILEDWQPNHSVWEQWSLSLTTFLILSIGSVYVRLKLKHEVLLHFVTLVNWFSWLCENVVVPKINM